MALNEYEQGATFPGRVGRTTDESAPAWPRPTRAVPGAPNVLTVVLDDTGFGQLGLLRQPDRDAELRRAGRRRPALQQHAHHGAVLAEPFVHPHRPQPPQQRHGLHHRVRHRLPRLQRRHPVRERLPVRDAARARLQHLHGRQVAPDPEQPGDRRRALRPLAAGARLRTLLRLPRRRHQPVVSRPGLRQPPGRAAGARPRRATTSPRTWSTRSIQFIADAKQIDPDKPFYLHLCFGATHAPHHVPKEWADKYAGKFDDGWDAYREKVFARQKELGIVPADAELSRHDPDVPDWDAQPEPARRLFSRMMEVFAGFLSHTDHHLGRLLDFLREQGLLDNTIVMVISDNGASAEGGPTGTTNEAQFFNNAQEPLEDSLAVHRRDRRPQALQPLPLGLDLGRQHAVPALEAGDLPRRCVRPVHRLVAAGHQGQGRGAHPVRAHHRHGPHRPGAARDRPARHDPGRHPVAAARRQLRATPSTTPTRRATTTPSTSRCSATAPSTTTAGARSAPGPGPRSPRPASASDSPSPPRRSPSSTPRAGSSTTWPRTSPRPATSRATTATSSSR